MRADGRIGMHSAWKLVRSNPATLKKAADLGYVEGLVKTPSGYYLATPEAWRKGLEAYRRALAEKRYPSDVPQGWITAAEAARRLGTRKETMLAIARAQLVPVYVRRSCGKKQYYAHPKAWERGLQRWRQGDGAWVRHRMMPKSSVDPETARRRLASLDTHQRVALRAFIRAVMLGLPLPRQWVQRLQDEFGTARAMYGEPESA